MDTVVYQKERDVKNHHYKKVDTAVKEFISSRLQDIDASDFFWVDTIEKDTIENLTDGYRGIGALHRINDIPRINKFFEQIKKASTQIHKLRNYGSAALDFAYVASGRADFAWYDHLNYWDYAAGKIILLEAGGTITDFSGKSFIKQKETFISNSYIHDEVLKILFKN